MRQFQSKKITKKNRKYSKNMGGGSSSARVASARVASASEADIALLFSEIVKPLPNEVGYYAAAFPPILSPEVFEQDLRQKGRRHALKITDKFYNIINTEYNSYGQTALYVVLRLNPTYEMIHMFLGVPGEYSFTGVPGIDVNRKNKIGQTDESTPLMGACFGHKIETKITWQLISDIIKLLGEKGANMTLTNTYRETALQLLDRKILNKGVVFT